MSTKFKTDVTYRCKGCGETVPSRKIGEAQGTVFSFHDMIEWPI